jgi:hypothetical protein
VSFQERPSADKRHQQPLAQQQPQAASAASSPDGGASPLRRSGAGPSALGIGSGPGWAEALQRSLRGAGSASGAALGPQHPGQRTGGAAGGVSFTAAQRPGSDLDRTLSHLAFQRAHSIAHALSLPRPSLPTAAPNGGSGIPEASPRGAEGNMAAGAPATAALKRAVTCIKTVRHVGLSAASKGAIVHSIADGALASFIIIQVCTTVIEGGPALVKGCGAAGGNWCCQGAACADDRSVRRATVRRECICLSDPGLASQAPSPSSRPLPTPADVIRWRLRTPAA